MPDNRVSPIFVIFKILLNVIATAEKGNRD